MLVVRIDSDVPLGDQIVKGIRHALAAGELLPGDELPSVRQLGADLGINLNTVARAYRELESQGLVRTARGRGTRVVSVRESRGEEEEATRSRITDAFRRALVDAKLAGIGPAETVEIVESEIRRLAQNEKEVRS